MAEERGDLHHLHVLAASRPEAEGLVESGGGDEGLVVPEASGLCHGRVPLGEEVLELVRLEEVGDGIVATVYGPPLALPPFVAHLLPPHRLHLRHRVRITFHHTRHHQQNQPHNCHNALRLHLRHHQLIRNARDGTWKQGMKEKSRCWVDGLFLFFFSKEMSGPKQCLNHLQVSGLDGGSWGEGVRGLRQITRLE